MPRLIPPSLPALAMVAVLLAAQPAPARAQASYEQLQALSGVLNYIRLNYVDTVTYQAMVHSAIDGILTSLDPHSYFISRADWERKSALERGELATTGIVLEEVDSTATVLAVYPGSPADRAGVQPGDRVTAVGDTIVAGEGAKSIELKLAGEKGSKVRVRLERGSRLEPDTVSLTLKRGFFKARYVSSVLMVDSITGYVRLEEFGSKAADEVENALRQLQKKKARQVILDLRSNPGGIVDESVEIASMFLPKGAVVFRAEGRKQAVNEEFRTKKDGRFRDLPLAVLINSHSASASEALAGSLQDHDRALIVGRRSFGKALMQTGFPVMPTGDVVVLTIGRIYTPSGRIIQRRYRGLGEAQYRSFAGRSGAAEDTMELFHTDHGRPVRGGGGIAPDVPVGVALAMPRWWTVAADSGFAEAVADSVAATLPEGPAGLDAWASSPDRWLSALVPPYLARTRTRLGVQAETTPELERVLAWQLARRAAEVRWGEEAAWSLGLRYDRDVQAAIEHFPNAGALLGPPE